MTGGLSLGQTLVILQRQEEILVLVEEGVFTEK